MGYLKQVKGMLMLGESPQVICRHLGLSSDTLCRFIEIESQQRMHRYESNMVKRKGVCASQRMMLAAILNSSK